MASFTFKSPEGQSYTVNGPEGATQEQAFGVVQQHVANQRAQGVVPINEKAIDTAAVPGGPRNEPNTPGFDPTAQPTDERGNNANGKLSDILTGPKQILGAVENAGSGLLSGAGSLAEAVTGAEPGSISSKAYQPHTEAGKEQAAAMSEGAGKLGHAAFEHAIAPSMRSLGHSEGDVEAARQTLAERVPQALGAVSTVVPLIGGAAKLARGVTPVVGESAGIAPPKAAPNPIERAQAAGFEAAPSDVARHTNAPVPGSTIQNLTETPGTAAERHLRNTDQATQLAAKDINLPPTTVITPEHIAAAKKAPGLVYDTVGQAVPEVRNVNPKTITALEDVMGDTTTPNAVKRDMGRMITGLKSGKYTGTQIMQDISSLRAEGVPGLRKASGALESELENQLSGQPESLAAYKGAREQFAKIQDVEDSLKGGRVDPQALLRLQEGARARPLSKGLAEIAHAASVLPDSVKMPGTVAPEGLSGHTPYGLKYGLIAKGIKGAVRAVAPKLNTPERQAAMSSVAPSAGPLPGPPTAGPLQLGNAFGEVGVRPQQGELPVPQGRAAAPGLELASPPGLVIEPLQRGAALPPGRGNPPPAPAFELAAPAGEVGVHPLQRDATLPRATAPLNVGRQVSDQLGLRNEALPGRAVGDNGPRVATQGAGVPNASAGRSARAHAHEEGAVPARVRELLQAIIEARRRGQ